MKHNLALERTLGIHMLRTTKNVLGKINSEAEKVVASLKEVHHRLGEIQKDLQMAGKLFETVSTKLNNVQLDYFFIEEIAASTRRRTGNVSMGELLTSGRRITGLDEEVAELGREIEKTSITVKDVAKNFEQISEPQVRFLNEKNSNIFIFAVFFLARIFSH